MTTNDKFVINGFNLNFNSLLYIVNNNKKILIDTSTLENLKKSRSLTLNTKQKVYGLNTGVGQNKDLNISDIYFEKFNKNLIKSHSISIGNNVSEKTSRLTFLIRINQLLKGYTGINPDIVEFMITIFNLGISPVFYNYGSVGEADIGILSSIGNLITGHGKVWFKHQQVKFISIVEKNKLILPVLGPKDGLALVSSNAFGIAQEIIALEKVNKVFYLSVKTFSLTAEGFDANVTSIDAETVNALNNKHYKEVTGYLLKELKNSYLFRKHKRKQLQDPISFRSAVHIFSAVIHVYKIAKDSVNQWLMSSDDNPIVISKRGVIISTGNFEVVELALFLENLNQSLAHLSRIIFQQIKHLNNDQFTGLPRFLIRQQGFQFGLQTLQKLAMDFDIRIRQLIKPVSVEFFGLADDIEDHSSNLPLIGETTLKICSYLLNLIVVELYNAVQANYLRFGENIKSNLGYGTYKLYESVRSLILPIKDDRYYGSEIEVLINKYKKELEI